MKRLVSLVLCFCVFLSCFEFPVYAGNETDIKTSAPVEQSTDIVDVQDDSAWNPEDGPIIVTDTAAASSSWLNSGDYCYLITGPDSCKITGYGGKDAVRVFPSQLEGYTVTGIGEYIIYNIPRLKELVIPDSVKTIDEYAFYRSDRLEKVTLPEGLTSIGEGAFSGCSALKEINIPETVTDFGANIFKNCHALENKYSSAPKPALVVGEEYDATIEIPDLYKLYYTFTPAETRTYIFKSTGEYDTVGYIYDSAMNMLASDDNGGENGNFSVSYVMEAGKVYTLAAEMRQNVGDFKVKVETTHEFTSQIINESTCIEKGLKKFSCIYCDYSYTDSMPYSHNYKTSDGKLYTCTTCSDNFTIGNKYPITDTVTRIKGRTRYETSLEICYATKEKMGVDKFNNIIIASGTNFADALAGSYLAKVKNAPILMTDGSNNDYLKAYISENLVQGGTVYILGGTAAVPQSTEDVLTGFNVKRIKGKTRYETNIEILKEAGVTNEEIIVATGTGFADSLSASAVGKPILLVDGKKELTQVQKDYLYTLGTEKFYIAGGTGAVAESYETALANFGSVERVKGKSRYETSVAIAQKFFTNPDYAIIAYAENFPDGLCGGPLAMTMNAPLILTKTGKQTAAKGYMHANGITNGAVLGGASLIDDATAIYIFSEDIAAPETKCPVCGSEEHLTHPTPTPGGGTAEKLSVVLVCSELGDKFFNESAVSGLKELKDKGIIDYKVVEYGWDHSKVNKTLETVAPDYDIVVCGNLGYGMATSWLRTNAALYPSTMFLVYDEPVDIVDNMPNVQMIAYKANEADFLAGALAGLISETGVIGFAGGMETPVVHDFLVGYVEGARYVNPDIQVKVSFVGSYTAAYIGKDLGISALSVGADVLHHAAGSAGLGYLEAAQEAGKWGIGADFDRYEVFKDEHSVLANSIITSSLKNIGRSLEIVISEISDGTYQWSQVRWFGIKEGGVGIAENEHYLANVSAEDQAVINSIKAKIASGEIVVSTAYGMDDATLRTYY